MKRFLAGFFLIGCWWNALAQVSKCEETLNQATEEFSAGHFYELPALLKPCLDRNDFSNEQRVRAYLLLTQTYLILDNPKDAEASYLKLLKADPEYIATPEKDPIDVVYLSKKFTSTPIFTPHVRIGLNTSFYRTIQDNSASPLPYDVHHGLRVGVQFGAGIDWNINDNWSLCADGLFSTKSYKLNVSRIDSTDNRVVTEKHFGIDVPVYLKYSHDKGKIRPYGYAGLAANFLFTAKAKMVLNNQTGASTQSAEGPDEDVYYMRKALTHSFLLGGGIKYKIGKDYLFVDLRYMAGMKNMTTQNIYGPKNKSATTENNNPSTVYEFVSGYYRLDNLAISVGYVRPIYNPRKTRKLHLGKVFHMFDRKQK